MQSGAQMLSDYTVFTKYAQLVPGESRRESWEECVQRCFDMHRRKFGENHESLLNHLEERVKAKRLVGSMRGLQMGGAGVERNNLRIFNCAGSYCDRLDFFRECFYLLLCGVGTGYSVSRAHVAQLPLMAVPDGTNPRTYQISDDIEGWADALGQLLESYRSNSHITPDAPQRAVEFSYSAIRPQGSQLSSGNGVAPGPEPLRTALEGIRSLLDALGDQNREFVLGSTDCIDIACIASRAVKSGGIRRSAMIALFDADDFEMMHAKTGDWFATHPWRELVNISMRHDPSTVSADFLHTINELAMGYGEPGAHFGQGISEVVNPCGEVGFVPVWQGESCWQFCNLTEINMAACESYEEFIGLCQDAAHLGTFQAAYTDFPYLGPASRALTEDESLLGISLTGVWEARPELLKAVVLQNGVQAAKAANARLSAVLGIPTAARLSCIKPSGCTSCVLNTSAGCHPHPARKYVRRVQISETDPAFTFLKDSGWMEQGLEGRYCLCFPVEAQGRVAPEIPLEDRLGMVQKLLEYWVHPGYGRGGSKHNVSHTTIVRAGEVDQYTNWMYEHKDLLGGTTILPDYGSMVYVQAPQATVSVEEPSAEILAHLESNDFWIWDAEKGAQDQESRRAQYTNALFAKLLTLEPIDWSKIITEIDPDRDGEVTCVGGACELQ